MTLIILIAVITGMLSGYLIVPESIANNMEIFSTIALNILILSVGIDVGSNKSILKDLKNTGFRVLLIPLCIILGSFTGGIITSLIYHIPMKSGLSIASGFGWYSLSGVMLSNLDGVNIGTIAFLTNIFRELIAVMLIPVIASRLNHYTVIAPAGATSMDTTLPLISEVTSPNITMISFLNGAILSSLVPVLISFFYSF